MSQINYFPPSYFLSSYFYYSYENEIREMVLPSAVRLTVSFRQGFLHHSRSQSKGNLEEGTDPGVSK